MAPDGLPCLYLRELARRYRARFDPAGETALLDRLGLLNDEV